MEKLRNYETIELKADDDDTAIVTRIDGTYDVNLFKRNCNYAYFTEIDIDLDRVYDILREYGFIKRH